MYRVYLRQPDQQVSEKTNTESQAAAASAFAALVDRVDLAGEKLAAVLSYSPKNGEKRQLAYHRFDKEPGHTDYWADRLDDIPWPTVGRPNQGKRPRGLTMTDEVFARAEMLGGGNASRGVERAVNTLFEQQGMIDESAVDQ